MQELEPGAPIKKSAGSRRPPQIECSACGVLRGSAGRENRGQALVQEPPIVPGSSPHRPADPRSRTHESRAWKAAWRRIRMRPVGSYGRLRRTCSREARRADPWRPVELSAIMAPRSRWAGVAEPSRDWGPRLRGRLLLASRQTGAGFPARVYGSADGTSSGRDATDPGPRRSGRPVRTP
jgi:hypothetical protein